MTQFVARSVVTPDAEVGARGSRVDRLCRATSVLGLAIIVFLLGIVVAVYRLPPYRTVRDALIGLAAIGEQQALLDSTWPEHLWYPAPGRDKGLVDRDHSQAYGDYTLYTSGHGCVALLVDMAGREVHRWDVPFRQVWPSAAQAPAWLPDRYVYLHRAAVDAQGNLLAVYDSTITTPSGCGLAKFDVGGELLWKCDLNAHHDFCVSDEGQIYVLTHRLRRLKNDDLACAEQVISVPSIEDCVTILSPDGVEQKTISILEALLDSPFCRPALWHIDHTGDITHNNTVNLVGRQFAQRHEGVSAGDLMICLRNRNLVVVLNPERGEFVWATTGPWNHPHDSDPLENGNILIFDNLLMWGTSDGSGVVEFDPQARQTIWTYAGTTEARLRSDIRSCQQALPNGNVLITESDRGRIIEVNRAGETVWEFVNPVRGGPDEELIPIVCGARRYTRTELPFLDALSATTQ